MKLTLSRSRRHRRRHNKRTKRYTKASKRLQRMQRKTRRLNRRVQYRMRGGELDANGLPKGMPVGGTPGNQTDAQRNQNAGNIALKGGSSCNKNQKGGSGSGRENYLALYEYTPKPGMMGPIPQVQDAAASALIRASAIISTTGAANAAYDNPP